MQRDAWLSLPTAWRGLGNRSAAVHRPQEASPRTMGVIPGRATAWWREPGIHKPRLWLWIPGPALTRRPGMTIVGCARFHGLLAAARRARRLGLRPRERLELAQAGVVERGQARDDLV